MTFYTEADFENALIDALTQKGWEEKIIKYPTEEDLIQNWADILFENNRSINRLNDFPLTSGEMSQILEQINSLRTPLKLNGFINGRTVVITRDNEDDTLHFGKEVSLKIYDRHEIAAGQSRYQIAQQPIFKSKSKILNDRRGDLMLLINGMPVIHIELKRSGIPVSQACHQIEKYSHENVFTGIFSLVQIFVAMEPRECVYFSNPGTSGKFNKDFYFHWADFNNEPINKWNKIAYSLLSIPMAHQLIGFYTVADENDGVLKVMRSYQYYAANAISDKVAKTDWQNPNRLGGFIWHTTGSGKTMTSFKSAQLIANSKNADKVIFLMDRIELGTQSFLEYRGFADESETVQDTKNTYALISKLKSDDPASTLIVTSIQKMSNIKDEENSLNSADIEKINSKRIVFIIDEAHRSTFGEMFINIKKTFTSAIFFGFTGTPIHEESMKNLNTTAMVFGDELHRYSIADGIRDKNVLGFDPYKILTYSDKDIRNAVALQMAKVGSIDEIWDNEKKQEVYYKYMDSSIVKMAGYIDDNGKYIKGIEDYVASSQYRRDEHTSLVVQNIVENWNVLSRNSKFHSIFATSSIPEAINYYRIFKKEAAHLKITCLFDPTIDNCDTAIYKEDGLVEIIEDYNAKYEQEFSLRNFASMKVDISARLSHKSPHQTIDRSPEKQIDILIVVDQMLTGFDSKWINTLYLDKVLRYENIIQAFSRTNRLFGPDKPFGTIKYYRYPHTMEQNIKRAVKLYSGDKPTQLFVEKLGYNVQKMNEIYSEIENIFESENIEDFEKLPDEISAKAKFASLFKNFNSHLEAAKIQGFDWDNTGSDIEINLTENIYLVLVLRYKELFSTGPAPLVTKDLPYEIEGYITEIDTGKIDTDYINTQFKKYIKSLDNNLESKELNKVLNDLHKSFSMLSQEEQKYANLFLHDIESGDAKLEQGLLFNDYINAYMLKAEDNRIMKLTKYLRVDKSKLVNLMSLNLNEKNLNEFGRFDDLKSSVDYNHAKSYFENIENAPLSMMKTKIKVHNLLKKFILENGFDMDELY